MERYRYEVSGEDTDGQYFYHYYEKAVAAHRFFDCNKTGTFRSIKIRELSIREGHMIWLEEMGDDDS